MPACGEQGGVCRVFVTSTSYDGNLGGLSGADAKCLTQAGLGGLTGTYRAWLSTSISSPATDASFTKASGPYRLVNGTPIAADWADLTDGALAAPINVTEFGVGAADTYVWTNTLPNGTAGGPLDGKDCGGWMGTPSGGGYIGRTFATNTQWTSLGLLSCQTPPARLYCFQQS